jgi:phosphate uptake regulator
VRNIIDSGVLTPEKAVRRMVMVCTSMIEDVLSGAPVEARTERAIGREGAVDRLNWLVARQYHLVLTDVQFTHKVELTPRKGLGYLLVARALERISDHARDIAAGRVPPAAAGPGKALPGVLERTVESFLSGSLDGADAAVDEAERLLSELGTLLDTAVSEGNPPAAANDAAFLYGLGRICSYTKDIGEIAVNQSMLGAD